MTRLVEVNSSFSLRARRRELSETLDELEDAQETLVRLSSGDRDKEDQKELDEARMRHSQLAELEARIQVATSNLELKERNLEQALQAEKQRRRLKDEITSEERALEAAMTRLVEVNVQEKEARSRLEERRTAVREAEAAVTKADKTVSRERRVLGAVQRKARVRELRGRCEKAQDAEKRKRESQQGVAAILVTDEAIKQIHTTAKGLETITNRLSAAATLITFDIAPERLSGIFLGFLQCSLGVLACRQFL